MKTIKTPPLISIHWHKQYRIIPTKFPPINIFQDLVAPEYLDALFELEGITNDRLSAEENIASSADRATGPGSSVVMAAFTHFSPSNPNRFSDGSYGIYYASRTIETAIYETVFHREKFLRNTHEEACSIDMRVYIGKVVKPMHDIRSKDYSYLHKKNNYSASQAFAKALREKGSWGVIYNSPRHAGGECIAAFRAAAVSIPTPSQTLTYVWDGNRITTVYEKSDVLYVF